MEPSTLFICGGQSTALEIAELVATLFPDCRIFHAIGDAEEVSAPSHIPQSRIGDAVRRCHERPCVLISMADPTIRVSWEETFADLPADYLTLIHPDATVAPSASMGKGCFAAAGVRVSTAARIGDHTILNLNATVGHHASTGCHVIVNPAAALSGRVAVGDRSLIGAHAFLFQGISVGHDCQVDALAYVRQSVPPGHLISSRSAAKALRRVDLPRSAFVEGSSR
jgi:UDP-3-O-[3-hydroxymyristoyl] glucosamine N-acyltransferase